MEIVVVIAGVVLVWMAWQLYRAKQFNHFRKLVINELKPKVVEHIQSHLIETRSDIYPNSSAHIQAATTYWCQYSVRVLQYALEHEVINKQWLIETGNYRHCQHLFHVEKRFMH